MENTLTRAALLFARGVVFTILLFLRPLVVGIGSIIGGLCLLGFVGTLLLAADQTTALWAFFTGGLVAVAISFAYSWILMLLAPPGFMMMMPGE